MDSQMILEYLRVLLSGPPVAGSVALLLAFLFRKELKEKIPSISRFRFPGGELSVSQTQRAAAAAGHASGALPKSENSSELQVSDLPEGLTLSKEQQEQLIDFIKAERARATLWEYRYLNYFLAPGTQIVLDWIATLPQRTTIPTYDTVWSAIIANSGERMAIIEALQRHHLILLNGELIELTPKGKEYRQWRGPLPEGRPNQATSADTDVRSPHIRAAE